MVKVNEHSMAFRLDLEPHTVPRLKTCDPACGRVLRQNQNAVVETVMVELAHHVQKPNIVVRFKDGRHASLQFRHYLLH